MANDVEITAGSGTDISTDQLAGGEHVQHVKIMDGVEDSGALIGGDAANGLDVDVTRVGKTVTKGSTTGAGAITASQAAADGDKLASVNIHFSAAPTTSEDLTITIDANDGSAYDTVLAKIDPAEFSLTDYVFVPEGDILLESGDAIDIAYTNTDAVTYGVQITLVR